MKNIFVNVILDQYRQKIIIDIYILNILHFFK